MQTVTFHTSYGSSGEFRCLFLLNVKSVEQRKQHVERTNSSDVTSENTIESCITSTWTTFLPTATLVINLTARSTSGNL